MTDTFTFTRQNKEETTLEDLDLWRERKLKLWATLKKKFENLIDPDQRKYKPFKVVLDKVDYSIPAYWVLMSIVKDWYFEQGNIYTKEQISEMFKHLAGHTQIINGVEVSRSIATSSDCTWLDMKKLLDFILRFGESESIIGLVLKPKDEAKIKKGFGE